MSPLRKDMTTLLEGRKRRSGAYADIMAHVARIDKEHARERKARTRYGVFVHQRGSGPLYDPADAIKVYKIEKLADKRARKEPHRNLVVRSFTID